MRKRTSRVLSFDGLGYIVASTLRPKSANYVPRNRHQHHPDLVEGQAGLPEPDFDHVAVVPVAPFLAVKKDPTAFAGIMEQKAQELIAEWVKRNTGLNPKDRVIAERSFVLHKHTYNVRGVLEHTQIEYQLSLFGYTLDSQKVEALVPPEIRNIKASHVATRSFRIPPDSFYFLSFSCASKCALVSLPRTLWTSLTSALRESSTRTDTRSPWPTC
jgi:hypothetical protein